MDRSEGASGSGQNGSSLPAITISRPTLAEPSAPSQQSNASNARSPRPLLPRDPTIRIRRAPSTTAMPQSNADTNTNLQAEEVSEHKTRHRSASAPQRFLGTTSPRSNVQRQQTTARLPALHEGRLAPDSHATGPFLQAEATTERARSGSRSGWSALGLRRTASTAAPPSSRTEYQPEIVDVLDVVGGYLSVAQRHEHRLIENRSRNLDPFHAHECPELSIRT